MMVCQRIRRASRVVEPTCLGFESKRHCLFYHGTVSRIVACRRHARLNGPQMLAETSLPLEEHLARLVAAAAVTEADPPSAFVDEAAAGSEGPAEAAGDVARRQQSARHHGLAPPSFSRASNRKLVRNALAHVCLAGGARAKEKEAALAAMDAVKVRGTSPAPFPSHHSGCYCNHEYYFGSVSCCLLVHRSTAPQVCLPSRRRLFRGRASKIVIAGR